MSTDTPWLWCSTRFGRVVVTRHAQERMSQRGVSVEELKSLLETGSIKNKDGRHLWIVKSFDDRNDNRVCAACVEDSALVIKTVMTHWEEYTG
ncbi:MAG: DUF4258 domain-containing protein [Magnetococcales bacterium]|nr:DUF4258 domain-containing protein [Magnetococcales bacterium]